MNEPVVVVAAALVRDDPPALLAAQRRHPVELAGRWELPGGKVEPGETEPDALRRELREELAVEVTVGGRAAADAATVGGAGVLRTYWATVVTGLPRPVEHAALRWLAAHELFDVEWLPPDVPVVTEIAAHLAAAARALP